MKIYELRADTNYQFMYPEDSVHNTLDWEFKAKPLIDILPKQFKSYFEQEKNKPRPDIARLGMATFATRSEVTSNFLDILEPTCELLPFWMDNEPWYCWNVLKVADAIDAEASKWLSTEPVRVGLSQPAFIESKLPKTSIFKTPTDNYTSIYCIDRRDNDEQIENNLFCAVAYHGYTGLTFEEVYSNE